jgi:hypothetical protein
MPVCLTSSRSAVARIDPAAVIVTKWSICLGEKPVSVMGSYIYTEEAYWPGIAERGDERFHRGNPHMALGFRPHGPNFTVEVEAAPPTSWT